MASLDWNPDTEVDERSEHESGQGLAWSTEKIIDGRVLIYTDGACRWNQFKRLRKAGVGAFWAEGHAKNISIPLPGPWQSNQRAELFALVCVLQSELRPLQV
eukprot:8370144-Karenia_brevis.AAC.1